MTNSNRNFSNNFTEIQNELKNLTKYQIQIEKLSKRKFNFSFTDWFYHTILGKKRYTVEELFDRELVSLIKMNVNLEVLLEESDEELKQLQNYKANLNSDIKRRRKFNSNHKGLTKLHEEQINKEAIIDLTNEYKSITNLYEVFHVSTMISQRLYEKTRRIERYVETTKRSYELLSQQQKSFHSLQNAIHDISNLTIGIHTLLTQGVSTMINVSQNNQPYCTALESPYPQLFPEWKVNDRLLSREIKTLERLTKS